MEKQKKSGGKRKGAGRPKAKEPYEVYSLNLPTNLINRLRQKYDKKNLANEIRKKIKELI
jgi:hypothetical protein